MSEEDRDPLYFPAVVLVCALLFATLMLGCAAPTRIAGTGQEVAPPRGWVDYCYRHRDDIDCKPMFDQIERDKKGLGI